MAERRQEHSVYLMWEGKHRPQRDGGEPDAMRLSEYYPPHLAKPGKKTADKPCNQLYQGENLQTMRFLAEPDWSGFSEEPDKSLVGKIDCIYVDPPFYSQADYYANVNLRGVRHLKTASPKLRIKQYGDRWSEAEYLQFIYERLLILRELLAESGSIYVHCDWHAVASLRLIMDEVFGSRNLLNEIVWHYGSGGGSKTRFGRKHDTILFYAKHAGRHYFDADAVRVPYRATIASKRAELFNSAGMVSPDVWDIPRPPNHAKSWLGYPTQKPLELVKRALSAACPAGGLVLDCFSGSGTTLVAAAQLGMNFIGVEQSALGVSLTRQRLISAGVEFGVYRKADDYTAFCDDSLEVQRRGGFIQITRFVPEELLAVLQSCAIQCEDWRELVGSVAIDWSYDGSVFVPDIWWESGTGGLIPDKFFIPNTANLAPAVLVSDISGAMHQLRL